MSVQLEVRPEIADKLTALAKARGVSVDNLLDAVLRELAPTGDRRGLSLKLIKTLMEEVEVSAEPKIIQPSLEEFERDMDSLAEGMAELPNGYQGTYSREDIYADHD